MALTKSSLIVYSLLLAVTVGAQDSPKREIKPFSIGSSDTDAALTKVIEMLESIEEQVQNEHKDEAFIYNDFSCFCKDKTERLTEMVNHHASQIDETSANIGDWTAQSNNARTNREERKRNHEKFSTELSDNRQLLKEENTEWDNTAATYQNDMRLISQALDSLKSSKRVANAGAFMQMPGIAKIKKELDIADAMGLFDDKKKQRAAATALLQGQASGNPLESYSYHEGSDDVIDLVEDLQGKLKELHDQKTVEHTKAVDSFTGMIDALEKKIKANTRSIAELKVSEFRMRRDIAETRQVLIENKQDLEDTDDVLKEVTSACEVRAREFKKREDARKAELLALNAALACLGNAHRHAKSQAAAGALIQALAKSHSDPKLLEAAATKADASKKEHAPAETKGAQKAGTKLATTSDSKADEKIASKPLSFLQDLRTSQQSAFLANSALSQEARQQKVFDFLRAEGIRTKSVMLTSLASKLPDNVFDKVIKLITDLRWRLEAEEHAEVDKHVWCRTKVEIAEHDRVHNFEIAKDAGVEAERLKAEMDKLQKSVEYFSNQAKEIEKSMVIIYTDVAQLSKEQIKTMNVQKQARDQIREAIKILRSYYTQSVRSKTNPYSLMQDDPSADDLKNILKDYRKERHQIREENERRADAEDDRNEDRKKADRQKIGDLLGDTPALARTGSLGDAVALMESIADDFDREIANIQGDLDKQHQQLVDTNRVLLAQKMHAEELRTLDMMDLKRKTIKRQIKMDDMQTAMDLTDSALMELETLKPTCIDTGMSYDERVKMRKEEMDALKKALCILGEKDKKFDCATVLNQ